MKSFYSSTKSSAAQQGHTLVELLVAISLGSVVLAFLGGVLLVSEMRVSAKIQRNLDEKDAGNRAIDLMRREASLSLFLTNSLSRNEDSSECWRTSPVAYHQTNGSTVCYKTVPPNWIKLPPGYQNAYQGPCLLVREGPPYKPDGEIDNLSVPIVQVLLDGVAKTSSENCTSRFNEGLVARVEPNRVNQKATIIIKMDIERNKPYNFSVQTPSNSAYAGNNLYHARNLVCTMAADFTQGCGNIGDAGASYTPESSSSFSPPPGCAFDICGTSSKENAFYFTKPFSQYTLSVIPGSVLPCTYASCYVQKTNSTFSVRLSNVDLLVFPDKEIRPTS